MEYIIKLKDKKVYESLIRFLISIGINVEYSNDSKTLIQKKTRINDKILLSDNIQNKYLDYDKFHLDIEKLKFNRDEINER